MVEAENEAAVDLNAVVVQHGHDVNVCMILPYATDTPHFQSNLDSAPMHKINYLRHVVAKHQPK